MEPLGAGPTREPSKQHLLCASQEKKEEEGDGKRSSTPNSELGAASAVPLRAALAVQLHSELGATLAAQFHSELGAQSYVVA